MSASVASVAMVRSWRPMWSPCACETKAHSTRRVASRCRDEPGIRSSPRWSSMGRRRIGRPFYTGRPTRRLPAGPLPWLLLQLLLLRLLLRRVVPRLLLVPLLAAGRVPLLLRAVLVLQLVNPFIERVEATLLLRHGTPPCERG